MKRQSQQTKPSSKGAKGGAGERMLVVNPFAVGVAVSVDLDFSLRGGLGVDSPFALEPNVSLDRRV